jgi:hypothetical protein
VDVGKLIIRETLDQPARASVNVARVVRHDDRRRRGGKRSKKGSRLKRWDRFVVDKGGSIKNDSARFREVQPR